MTAPEVEWVLTQLGIVADGVATDYSLSAERNNDPVQLRRVDRDEAQVYDSDETVAMSEPLPERKTALESGAYVGVASVDSDETPIGTGFDLDLERVVGLRLEGLHYAEYGHIDPSGEDGIPFAELKRRVRTALYDQRTFPDAGATDVSFTHLQLTNVADTSSDWRDFYRWDADIVFDGFEEL
jgi:hypothetical protein